MDYSKEFIDYLKYEKRYSVHTIIAYQSDLFFFKNFYHEQYPGSTILHAHSKEIRAWVVELMQKKISTRSINRKLSTLKKYYKFLLREKVIELNPMNKIISPRVMKKLPNFIEEERVNFLLDDVMRGNDYASWRDRMVVETLYNLGLRLSEIVNLEQEDIDLYNLQVKVRGKRNKERIIPISLKFRDLLKQYFNILNDFSPETGRKFVFFTDSGNQMYPKFVYRLVHKWITQVSTTEKKSPHVMRHTFATHMLNRGADLNGIKELLGHANLSATQVYTHNSFKKLKDIYSKAHPRA